MKRRSNLRIAAVAHDLAANNVDAAFLASMAEVQRGPLWGKPSCSSGWLNFFVLDFGCWFSWFALLKLGGSETNCKYCNSAVCALNSRTAPMKAGFHDALIQTIRMTSAYSSWVRDKDVTCLRWVSCMAGLGKGESFFEQSIAAFRDGEIAALSGCASRWQKVLQKNKG